MTTYSVTYWSRRSAGVGGRSWSCPRWTGKLAYGATTRTSMTTSTSWTYKSATNTGLCVRVMFSFSCCVVFLRLLSKSTLFFPYLLIYILHFLFICYIFFTITVTSNSYPRSVSASWIWLGWFWSGGFWTCPVSTYLQMKKMYKLFSLTVIIKKICWQANGLVDFGLRFAFI